MNRRNFFTQLFVTALALFAVSLPALAQAKVTDHLGILRIMEVTKKDAAAKLVGKKRLVPVSVNLELAELIAEAKLKNVRLEPTGVWSPPSSGPPGCSLTRFLR